MRPYQSLVWLLIFAGALVITSCSGTVRYKKTGRPAPDTEVVVAKKGPPPHAPAHGYRHKHGNLVLVYQSDLSIYVVDGHEGYFFFEGEFFRSHKGKWQSSRQFNGPWKKISESKLPKGLRNAQHASAKKKK